MDDRLERVSRRKKGREGEWGSKKWKEYQGKTKRKWGWQRLYACVYVHAIICVYILPELSAALAERWGRLPWRLLNCPPKYSHMSRSRLLVPQSQLRVTASCRCMSRCSSMPNDQPLTLWVMKLHAADRCTLHPLPMTSHSGGSTSIVTVRSHTHSHTRAQTGRIFMVQSTDALMHDWICSNRQKAPLIVHFRFSWHWVLW